MTDKNWSITEIIQEVNMDFKVNCESMPLSETIFSGIQEQSIELEYILPDYFPDIFKIIKCRVIPGITSRNISSEKAVYEITVDIKVLYQNEHSSTIQCISQRQVYTKTIDFFKTVRKCRGYNMPRG